MDQLETAAPVPVPATGGRGPLQAGELVVLIDHKARRHMIRLQPGGQWHTKWGILPHDQIIGQEDGVRLRLPAGRPVVAWRPTLEDFVMEMPRKTQIIYPKDLGLILMRGNIFPGARVMQTGLGSGSLACALIRYLGPEGTLVSYEYRQEFARVAERNLQNFLGYAPPNHRIEIRDAYAGIDERDLDTLILDLPEPERVVSAAAEALKSGGILLSWLPTTIQVHKLVVALRADLRFDQIDAVELILRPWYVTEESMRPVHRMVGHTGFLISARRCPPRPHAAPPPEPDDDDLTERDEE